MLTVYRKLKCGWFSVALARRLILYKHMSRNSLCDTHHQEATLFCLSESESILLCTNCLPEHEGHETYPIAQYELFQTLGTDKAELKRRNTVSQNCQSFIDRVVQKEAAMQSEARTLINTLHQNYDIWLEENHRFFDGILQTLREEAALLLTRQKYQVSPIAQLLFDKQDALDLEDEQKFVCVPEIEALRQLNERWQEVRSRASQVRQADYEEKVLQGFAALQQTQKEATVPSVSIEEGRSLTVQLSLEGLTRKLETLQSILHSKESDCAVLEKEIEKLDKHDQSLANQLQETTVKLDKILSDLAISNQQNCALETRLRNWGITSDPPIESQEPVPDYSTPNSRTALMKFGTYFGQDEECLLVKRGPVLDATGVYIGQWNARNERHGYGKYFCGDMYEGQWRNGKKTGRGRMIWANGAVYVGDFVQDKMEGFGTLYCTNGDEYTGCWVNDTRHGLGSFKYGEGSSQAGNRCIGDYLDGELNGLGAYFCADGAMYVASMMSDKMHGKGLFANRKGKMYFGEYEEGLFAGTGCYVYPNGDVYRGKWGRGKRNGLGELTHPGTVERGVWANDVLRDKLA